MNTDFKKYVVNARNKIHSILTKNKSVAILIIIISLITMVPWQCVRNVIFPPIPKISADLITIPSETSNYTEEFSVFNSRDNSFNDLIIKFESTDNYKISIATFIIEPKNHIIVAGIDDIFSIDANFISYYDSNKNVMYLKINDLKPNESLDYILRIRNEDHKLHNIKISISEHEVLKKIESVPFFAYLFRKYFNDSKCNMEERPIGLHGLSRRLNPCFGGIKLNISSKIHDVYALNLWLFPEWEENETNYIFDMGQEQTTNRISIYRNKNYLVTEIYESNGYLHKLKEYIEFVDDWNDIYFALDKTNNNYKLYLNTKLVIDYTFKSLTFEYPKLFYLGINSNVESNIRNYGNFLLDDIMLWSRTLYN